MPSACRNHTERRDSEDQCSLHIFTAFQHEHEKLSQDNTTLVTLIPKQLFYSQYTTFSASSMVNACFLLAVKKCSLATENITTLLLSKFGNTLFIEKKKVHPQEDQMKSPVTRLNFMKSVQHTCYLPSVCLFPPASWNTVFRNNLTVACLPQQKVKIKYVTV